MAALKHKFDLSVGDMLVANPALPADGPMEPLSKAVLVVTNYYPDEGLVEAVNITRPDADYAAEIEHEMIDGGISGECFTASKVFKGGPQAGSLTVVEAAEYDVMTGDMGAEERTLYALQLATQETAAAFPHFDRIFAADGAFRPSAQDLHRQISDNLWRVLSYAPDIIFETAPEDRYLKAAQEVGWDLTDGMQ